MILEGKKYFKIKEIKAYLNIANAKSTVVNLQFRKYSLINKMKTVHVSTLMEKCFKLNPPDKFHFYDLTFKDGNCFNSELSNLEYRIRTHSASNYNYYPQPFYNLKSIIIKYVEIVEIKKKLKILIYKNQKRNAKIKHIEMYVKLVGQRSNGKI